MYQSSFFPLRTIVGKAIPEGKKSQSSKTPSNRKFVPYETHSYYSGQPVGNRGCHEIEPIFENGGALRRFRTLPDIEAHCGGWTTGGGIGTCFA